jgi:hypothetical protein
VGNYAVSDGFYVVRFAFSGKNVMQTTEYGRWSFRGMLLYAEPYATLFAEEATILAAVRKLSEKPLMSKTIIPIACVTIIHNFFI